MRHGTQDVVVVSYEGLALRNETKYRVPYRKIKKLFSFFFQNTKAKRQFYPYIVHGETSCTKNENLQKVRFIM
jgi:hypothetical protein